MRNLRSNIETGSQVIIALAVVAIAGVAAARYISSRTHYANKPRVKIGEQLNVPNVNWENNKKTLVFFLMKDCVYCAASARFYRELIDEASKRNVKSLAVFPNSIEEARKYIQYLDLPIQDIQTGSLADYKISGTPTLLFIDRRGTVRGACFGAAPEKEKEMRDNLVRLFDSPS